MVKKVHTDIYHKHYLENNLVCIANNVPDPMGFGLGDGTGPAEESQEDETRPGMVSSNWVGYIVCNTH